MDRSAQNIDRSSECEIMDLRRRRYAFDVSPLEIIHGDGGGVLNINQIDLVIHAIHHDTIIQYWSLKSDQQLNSSSSSSCNYQHHRDHHHLRDADDDEEMMMVVCQPILFLLTTRDQIIHLDRGVFASYEDDHRQKVIIKEDVGKDAAADDDYIMSQLNDVDAFYELEWIGSYEQLEEVKRCIIQRISESKLAVQLAKPKTVRIRVDLSIIRKVYYANPAAAASAFEEDELNYRTVDECFAYLHYINYDYDASLRSSNASLRSSKDALETKIFEEEDLISSSSSSSCSVCLNEFRVGVDVTKKMPCSHLFHLSCLMNWLFKSNTCPLCRHELPTFKSRFPEEEENDNELPITYPFQVFVS